MLDGALGLAHSKLDATASELKDTKAALAVERLENQKEIRQLKKTLGDHLGCRFGAALGQMPWPHVKLAQARALPKREAAGDNEL